MWLVRITGAWPGTQAVVLLAEIRVGKEGSGVDTGSLHSSIFADK